MQYTWLRYRDRFWLVAWSVGFLLVGVRAGTVSYSYDEAGRLLQADYGGSTIDYVYDANGNLLQRTVTEGETIYTLIYHAGTGGTVAGLSVVTQQVARGESGTAVPAVEDNTSVVFRRWSDGNPAPTRTDTNVQRDLDVRALFSSTGGADLDWYAARDIEPEPGEDWTHVDARLVAGKGTTLRHENIADTDPDNPNDTFQILAVDSGPPVAVTFRPGSTGRVYRLLGIDDLLGGAWTNVSGAGPRPGVGEGPARYDTLADENHPPQGPFYRVEVELP